MFCEFVRVCVCVYKAECCGYLCVFWRVCVPCGLLFPLIIINGSWTVPAPLSSPALNMGGPWALKLEWLVLGPSGR